MSRFSATLDYDSENTLKVSTWCSSHLQEDGMLDIPKPPVSREGRVPVWRLRTICVFCGSCSGRGTDYEEAARELGKELVSRRIRLVYGGGATGLMGALADQVLALGGTVTGVIPEGLARKEVCHQGLSTTHVVASMHERKALMHELADAFIALPGGYGTFEELLEAITWVQLGLSPKPVGVLNVNGYYDPLLAQIGNAVVHGFIRSPYTRLLVKAESPSGLLDRLARQQIPASDLWQPPAEL